MESSLSTVAPGSRSADAARASSVEIWMRALGATDGFASRMRNATRRPTNADSVVYERSATLERAVTVMHRRQPDPGEEGECKSQVVTVVDPPTSIAKTMAVRGPSASAG
jgi:hypothetical protein